MSLCDSFPIRQEHYNVLEFAKTIEELQNAPRTNDFIGDILIFPNREVITRYKGIGILMNLRKYL